MTALKTLTDEGKREFEEKIGKWIRDKSFVMNNEAVEYIKEFMDLYAEMVATETMNAILPEPQNTQCTCGNCYSLKTGKIWWNDCRASVEQAFQTFLGKV